MWKADVVRNLSFPFAHSYTHTRGQELSVASDIACSPAGVCVHGPRYEWWNYTHHDSFMCHQLNYRWTSRAEGGHHDHQADGICSRKCSNALSPFLPPSLSFTLACKTFPKPKPFCVGGIGGSNFTPRMLSLCKWMSVRRVYALIAWFKFNLKHAHITQNACLCVLQLCVYVCMCVSLYVRSFGFCQQCYAAGKGCGWFRDVRWRCWQHSAAVNDLQLSLYLYRNEPPCPGKCGIIKI